MTPAGAHEALGDRLLPTCPRCGYSLQGLPVQHRCPECGLEVDRRWRVFGGRSVSRALVWLARGLVLAFIGVAAANVFLAVVLAGRPRVIALLVIVPICTACIIGRLLYRRPSCFIGLGPDGIFVYLGRQSRTHAWTEVRDAHLAILHRQLVLDTSEGEVRLPLDEFFGGMGGVNAERCVRTINEYVTMLQQRREILSQMDNT